MAIILSKELTLEEKATLRESLRTKFFILTHVGGLMILMSSIHPFFAANHIPGILILMISLGYDHWPNASTVLKLLMLMCGLICSLWIGINALNKWYLPPILNNTSSTIFPTFINSELTLTFGYIGHVIVLIGVVQAFRELILKRSCT